MVKEELSPRLAETTKDPAVRERVGALFETMKAERFEELEIRDGDFYVHIKRAGSRSMGMMVHHAPPAAHAPAQSVQPVAADTSAAALEGDHVVSPLMGIFYRAPSPTMAPFAKDGDMIEPGRTICIIEAMKVMNEIKAEFRMKIIRIMVENGTPVSAEQPLFLIEKA